ncbi:uncharacterized protein BCR38DRAFT_435819 [Pseudomassariella vexata]|uniref:Glutamine repeat protein-1 n=1 Tax=Pseudomassariella vexata TaxID=1141098 RepID=A0A1Y2DUZ1_9PEZI|nr:uncharacterized protein BCR38DRAFT_435819 [Pseudomassariella vexata]ORY63078.1 hypothetical protein BCR38DRAFT_435819 [Pseudomassariella vexata]
MYSGHYGFPNAAGAPPPQNPHLQPGQGPNPNQAQQQQMMYNPQHFPMGPQGGGFPGAPNMMPGAGPAGGMMQNNGMPMAVSNGQMHNYPASYSHSPYGGGIPTSVAPQMNVPPNYAMGGGMPMSGFPMHPGQMTPQQQQQQQMMMQRMQQQSHPSSAGGMSASTPQRPFPVQGHGPGPQGTPTPTTQQQFATPQNAQGTPRAQTPNSAHPQPQQPSSAHAQTPQTPTFPSSVQTGTINGASSNSTPLSPGGDSRDKERLAVILEINNELLLEAMQLQHTQAVLKKEHASPRDGAASELEKKPTEVEDLVSQDYVQVMRRLQSNLSYLASLADKKGSVQAAPCPAYLKPPPLNTKVKLRQMPGPDGVEGKPEATDREETAKYMQELYTKLQGLYPGIDPNKEPAHQMPNARPGAPGLSGPKLGSQTPNQASPVPGNKNTPQLAASAPQPQVNQSTVNATP